MLIPARRGGCVPSNWVQEDGFLLVDVGVVSFVLYFVNVVSIVLFSYMTFKLKRISGKTLRAMLGAAAAVVAHVEVDAVSADYIALLRRYAQGTHRSRWIRLTMHGRMRLPRHAAHLLTISAASMRVVRPERCVVLLCVQIPSATATSTAVAATLLQVESESPPTPAGQSHSVASVHRGRSSVTAGRLRDWGS